LRTAIDSNILSAIWSREASAKQVAQLLDESGAMGSLVLSAAAYAELHAHPRISPNSIRHNLEEFEIQVDFALTESVWSEAGLRNAQYVERKRKATGQLDRRLIADFIVGAHALLSADRLMTMDVRRYRSYFPELVMVELAQ
jgi:predicted nucleic acid-binding protein